MNGCGDRNHKRKKFYEAWQRWAPLRIVLLTSVAFLPGLGNEFVSWDDVDYIVSNPHLRVFTWENISWMFTTFHMGPYQPLPWITWALDYQIWGLNPVGYHLTNLIFHIANAVLLFYVFRVLLQNFPLKIRERKIHDLAAEFGALFFALHPLRVEAVVWASQRRDVVAGFFFLLCVLFYVRSHTYGGNIPKGRVCFQLSVVAFAFSLLSKGTVISIPLVLLIVDVYLLGRSGFRLLIEKLPYALLAVGAATIAYIGQVKEGAIKSLQEVSILERLLYSVFAFGFYVYKTLLPFNLSPLYERPPSPPLPQMTFLLSILSAVTVTVVVCSRRCRREMMAAYLIYTILLFPVAGLIPLGFQIAADRYTYLACMPWAALAGAGVNWLGFRAATVRERQGRVEISSSYRSLTVAVLFALMIATFAVLTWRQTVVWRDTETLWQHALSMNPRSLVAHTNLGYEYLNQYRLGEASQHFRAAIRIRASAEGHYGLARTLQQQGYPEEAISHFSEALRQEPNNAVIREALAGALSSREQGVQRQ